MSSKSHDKYAIFWCSMLNDEWFLSLNATERGVFVQLVLMSKRAEDDGFVRGRSWAYFGSAWGCDGKTARKIAGNFQASSRLKIKLSPSCIELFLCNYEEHQHLRKIEKKLKRGNFRENSSPIEQHNIKQHNIEQNDRKSNPDQSTPALQEDKENQDGTESVGTALEQFWAWGAIPANREAVHKLCGMIHYDQIAGDHNNHKQFLLDHVVKGEFGAHLIAKSDAALESLKINHDGSWLRMLKSWLDRILRDIRSGKRKRPTALSGGMSYEQEQAHFARHRNRSGGGMQKIDQLISNKESVK